MSKGFISAVAAAWMLVVPAAFAHRLDADYAQTPSGFRIEFFTGDGSPAGDLRVTAQLEGGEPIEIGRTDQQGFVSFVPPAVGEWTIVGTGAGHSTSRNPLKIQVDAIAESASAVTTTSSSAPAAPATTTPHEPAVASETATRAQAARGGFPWTETLISLTFITILTAGTLLMMRRSSRLASHPTQADELLHEVAHLRATVAQLQTELTHLKAQREHRA